MLNDSIVQATQSFSILHLPDDLERFHQWIFNIIKPYLRGSILEMASGHGGISEFLICQGIPLYLSDPHKRNRDNLRNKFEGNELIKTVNYIDFDCTDFETFYSEIFGSFTTVFGLNIPENGFYSKIALTNATHLLNKHGYLIFIAPAHTTLYHGLDGDINNWTKYNHKRLRN